MIIISYANPSDYLAKCIEQTIIKGMMNIYHSQSQSYLYQPKREVQTNIRIQLFGWSKQYFQKKDGQPVLFYYIINLFQSSQTLQLNPPTRYLARVYFDQVIKFYQDLQWSQYLKLGIACISIAIKFNESREVSDFLSLQRLFKFADLMFYGDDCLNIELRVINVLGFKFKYSTPFDYINHFAARFPWFPKLAPALIDTLNVANIIVEGCQHTAEELFYGSVLAIFEYKQIRLEEIQRNVLASMTDCWTSAEAVKGKVLLRIQSWCKAIRSQ